MSSTGSYKQICNHCLDLLKKRDLCTDSAAPGKSKQRRKQKEDLTQEGFTVDEDVTPSDLFEVYLETLDDDNILEEDRMLWNESKKNDRIAAPREMGDWIEVEVNGSTGNITSNSEEYSIGRYSCEVAFLEVIQMCKYPPSNCRSAGEVWTNIRNKAVQNLIKALGVRTRAWLNQRPSARDTQQLASTEETTRQGEERVHSDSRVVAVSLPFFFILK